MDDTYMLADVKILALIGNRRWRVILKKNKTIVEEPSW